MRRFVAALRDAAAPARFLITCREPLELPGLGKPRDLDRLPAPYDETLFRTLAEEGGYEWRTGDEERRHELLRDLDGLPLAITLAAAWLEEFTLEDVLARWRNRRTAALALLNEKRACP